MNQPYEAEERAFDALVVALFHAPRELAPLSDFAALSEDDLALLDAIPANLIETLWADETRAKPAPVGGRGGSPLSFISVLSSITMVALLFYGSFLAVAWNLRPDMIPWSSWTESQDHHAHATNEGSSTAAAPQVATITGETECTWATPAEEFPGGQPGDNLPAQKPLSLQSGCVEMTLANGIRLAIEGPARFELQSPERLTLNAGKLLAQVPPKATGFTVVTPHAEIVDLGTEFTVEVAQGGLARVAVIRGKVNVQAGGLQQVGVAVTAPTLLTAGNSIEIASVGDFKSIPYQPAQFSQAVLEATPPPNPDSFKDGYRIVAWYSAADASGQGLPAPDGQQMVKLPARSDAYFEGPLQATGPVLLEPAVDLPSGNALRVADHGKPAVLTARNLPNLTDHFVLEAKLRPDSMAEAPAVYYGDMAQDGVGIAVRLEQWCVMLGGVGVLPSGIRCQPGKWTHVAVVLEEGQISLLVDGERGEGPWQLRGRTSDGRLSVGGYPTVPRPFTGQIGDVRLLDLQQKFEPRMLLPGSRVE